MDDLQDVHKEWRNQSNNPSVLNDLFGEGVFDEVVRSKLSDYYELEDYLSEATRIHKSAFGSVYNLSDLDLEVLIINTAAGSKGGSKNIDRDEGFMFIPEHAMLKLFDKLTGKFCIIVTHHPISALSETTARLLRQKIQANSSIHLFGHVHDPVAENIQGFSGSVFASQAGAIYTHRTEYYIGYSIISLSRGSGAVEAVYRTYFPERDFFDAAIDRVKGGVFYPNPESRAYFHDQVAPFNEDELRSHLLECGTAELFLNREGAESEKDVTVLFAAPPISRQAITASESIDDPEDRFQSDIAIDEILSAQSNEIIVAQPEHGRTIFLRHLQYRILTGAMDRNRPDNPIFIDYSDIKTNVDATLRAIKAASVSLPRDVQVEDLLRLGYCTLLVDDVDFSNARRLDILKEIIKKYPKSRYILSTPKAELFAFGTLAVPKMPAHFGVLEICALRRKQMRQLVKNYNPGADSEALLEELHSEFSQMNLPLTAANGTILMEIYEAHPNFKAINRSGVIEQFVDATLRKAAAEQVRRETFDYSNKTSMLASLAAWMATEDNYKPSGEEVRQFFSRYLNELGLIADVDDLQSEFFSARILVRRAEGRVSFRYRSVLEYFIALQMGNDSDFKEWVLSEERYLQFINEIQYYAGKNRSDVALLDLVGSRFASIVDEVRVEYPDLDLNKISQLVLPLGADTSSIDDLATQLQAPPLDEQERDKELEAEIPRDVEDRQEVFRPKVADLGSKLLICLFLYSGALKNLETVRDIEKRRHLSSVLEGWSIFLNLSFIIVPAVASKRRYVMNGVTFIVNAPRSMSDDELARIIAIHMPTGISNWVNASLGTEKMERQLSEPSLDSISEPLIYEFFKAALITDLQLPSAPSAIRAFFEKVRGNRYLVEALIWKMKEVRRLNKIANRQFEIITPYLAGAIAELKGGSKKVRDKEKSSQIQRIKRQTVRIKLARLHERDGDR